MPKKMKQQQMAKVDFCSKHLTLTSQTGPTCWFNSLLTAMFYSQYSRKKMLRASHSWNTNIKILKIFDHILHHKYKTSDQSDKDKKFFTMITPEYILQLLHRHDKTLLS
jgi:hypothetical protein